MKDDQSSDTALGATVIRAVHQVLDTRPLILEDPISPLLVGDDGMRAIQENPGRHATLAARGLRSHIVLRSRYAEDELRLASGSGITQFINLGAGFDTFAFRQPGWAGRLKIVEVDHPATQAAKREALEKARITVAPNVDFLPLDLERSAFLLAAAAPFLDASRPTFVACLGVLAYLRPQTTESVFHAVAKMPRGSRLLFAFASHEPSALTPGASVAERTAARGEPWLTRFDASELEPRLLSIGFRTVVFLDPARAAARYYRDRTDLPAPRKTRLCQAVV
ncbi:MAG TPA: class I SAM-dependent methyltransferase [Spirochaetia bacterium]|nr:class I SAM-dependent methyltransferase [Spirochaetia bacterium]